jgi:hypothetical protein
VRGRLSKQAVREIREWWATYCLVPKPREISARYGIRRDTVYDVAQGRLYKAVK